MKKIILILSILVCNFTIAQNNGHIKGKEIERGKLLDNDTKFISLGFFEIILWDLESKNIIWKKTYKELGISEGSFYPKYWNINKEMTWLTIGNSDDGKNYIIDLNKTKTYNWDFNNFIFAADDYIPVVKTNTGEYGKHNCYLYDAKTGQGILIGEKNTSYYEIADDGNLIIMIDLKGKKSSYDIKSKTFSKTFKDKNSKTFDDSYSNWKANGSKENYYFEFGENTFGFYNTNNEKKEFNTEFIKGKKINDIETIGFINPKLIKLDKKEKKVYYIENFYTSHSNGCCPEMHTYFTTYDIETGKLINSLNLINESKENDAIIAMDSEKRWASQNEESRINNLPENVLKRRLNLIKGKYFYNNLNKCIYFVDENSGLFEGDLVKMIAKHDDKKQEIDVYEHLDKIENTLNYKEIKSFGRCGVCFGRGYISNTYNTTAADYEYTYGVKIIKSTTKTNSCNQCGGCGLNPK